MTRPQLIFGCDRVPFLLLMLVCIALGMIGGIASENYANAVGAVVLFIVGVKALGSIAKYDPDAMKVFQRALGYSDVYSATSRATHPDKKY
ncbi:MAG: VirB3 family type IV secretion system protein [Synergistaceae bacterium]|nr:VirB3 family type IV secretion system protein [Synergistaceae bacterium]